MLITPLYAAILAIVFLKLSMNTISLRKANKVEVGDGGNKSLSKAMRAHGNFTEYVPLSLLLLFFVESLYQLNWLIHILGTTLVLGRIIHAYGISQVKENYKFRVAGMLMTFAVIFIASLSMLARYF